MQAAHIPTTTHDEFVTASVTVLEKAIAGAIHRLGRCVLGLSGGSTPGPVYERLGRKTSIDWERVHLFLVDERCVPITDDRSNALLVGQTLLKHAAIPDLQRHFPDTALPPADGADAYDFALRALLPDDGPDVVVLGMGDDGHVASLFPPLTPTDLSTTDYAIHTHVPVKDDGEPRFPVKDRISTTLRLLRTADTKVFLLHGEGKRTPWEATTEDGASPLQWPGSVLLHHAIAVTRW